MSPGGSPARRSTFDVEGRRKEVADLERQLSRPDVWDDPSRGQRLNTQLARIRQDLDRYDSLAEGLEEAEVFDQLLDESPDGEIERELQRTLDGVEADLARLELASLLGGAYDRNDAVASLHAGAGGTESQDWAEMLLRMYLRWAEREGFDVELDELNPGEEAGIKSATFILRGPNAYGLLSAE